MVALANVGVYRLPARFAPPERCNWDDAYAPDQSCTAAGPDLWRRSEDSRSVVYLIRKGSALVTLSQGGDTINEERLRQAARKLAPRPARILPPPQLQVGRTSAGAAAIHDLGRWL